MPKRLRLTRRFPVAMTEDGYRRLKRFAKEAGLDEGEALSFLFENFDSVRPSGGSFRAKMKEQLRSELVRVPQIIRALGRSNTSRSVTLDAKSVSTYWRNDRDRTLRLMLS